MEIPQENTCRFFAELQGYSAKRFNEGDRSLEAAKEAAMATSLKILEEDLVGHEVEVTEKQANYIAKALMESLNVFQEAGTNPPTYSHRGAYPTAMLAIAAYMRTL